MRKKMKKQLIRSYIVIIISFILLGTLLLAATIMDAEAVDFKQAGYIGGPLLYIIYYINISNIFYDKKRLL